MNNYAALIDEIKCINNAWGYVGVKAVALQQQGIGKKGRMVDIITRSVILLP